MKEIKINEVNSTFKYEAIDGEVFDDKEQCILYEKSAVCLIKSRILHCKVGVPQDAWKLMGGYDDHLVQAYKVTTEKEADYFMQWVFSMCGWWNEEKKQSFINDIEKALATGDLILIGINCDDEPYYINIRQNIIDGLNNLENLETSE